jgi:predicted DNA-binding WGR domain protein
MKRALPPALKLFSASTGGPGRLYTLTITRSRQLSLFPGGPEGAAGWTLVVAWGSAGPGKKLRVRREEFTRQRDLVARWRELVARRRRNGYAEFDDVKPARPRRRGRMWAGTPTLAL